MSKTEAETAEKSKSKLSVADLAFEKLDAIRIEIRCDAENVRSYRVAEKLGYQLEGKLKQETLSTNLAKKYRDTLIFAKIKPDDKHKLKKDFEIESKPTPHCR